MRSLSLVPALRRAVVAAAACWGVTSEARGAADADRVEGLRASAARAADAGTFSPWSIAPRNDTQRALFQASGGYDAARRGAVFESTIEVQVLGLLSLRAGAASVERNAEPNAGVRPSLAARFDVLRQEGHGVDLAVLSGYESYGFNLVPAIATRVAVGRGWDRLRVLLNAGYGAGLKLGEHAGEVRGALFYRLASRVRVGFDSRARVDLERDDDEPAGEPEWDVVAGPVATVTFGSFAVTASTGVSAVRRRFAPRTDLGAAGTLSVGAVF